MKPRISRSGEMRRKVEKPIIYNKGKGNRPLSTNKLQKKEKKIRTNDKLTEIAPIDIDRERKRIVPDV